MKVVVGRVSDFANGDRKIIDVNGKSIGIFRVDDRFYAIRNRCPHQFGPLCVGTLAQRAVSDGPGDLRMDDGPPLIACPWHGWEYDLATGQSFMGPGRGAMAALSYEVIVQPGRELAAGREPTAASRARTSPRRCRSRSSRTTCSSTTRPPGRRRRGHDPGGMFGRP